MGEPSTAVSDFDQLSERVAPGTDALFRLTISESYSGVMVRVPVVVRRGLRPGPAVFLTAALHGNEINGTGAIRQLIGEPDFTLAAGMLLMVPVVNVHGFETYSRYLPDRRDLNRCFPGSSRGSLAARMADKLFREIVRRCDYGLDLHTASIRRTNFPNVRGDLSDPGVAKIAAAFGCQWIIDNRGPQGSLRREATKAGVPTIILEAGEVWKVEPTVVAVAVRGVRNVLATLGMTDETPEPSPIQHRIKTTRWTRAERGGFLEFHVAPGEVVRKDQPLATAYSLLGAERDAIVSPIDAVVIGMTTLPAATPGEPVIHLGQISASLAEELQSKRSVRQIDPLHGQVKEDLATNIVVTQRDAEETEGTETADRKTAD